LMRDCLPCGYLCLSLHIHKKAYDEDRGLNMTPESLPPSSAFLPFTFTFAPASMYHSTTNAQPCTKISQVSSNCPSWYHGEDHLFSSVTVEKPALSYSSVFVPSSLAQFSHYLVSAKISLVRVVAMKHYDEFML
jgi:hypothetical protein